MRYLEREITQRVAARGGRIPTTTRIKVGRGIIAWSLIPCNMSIWMLPIGAMLALPIKPTLWAKDKLRNLYELRWLR